MTERGVLLHISSLPSRYGIGTFGRAAYEFCDFLTENGQKYWQILPLTTTSYGDSPYQSPSAFAGNPYFIDLDMLREDGLLQYSEYSHIDFGSGKSIDYKKLYDNRYPVLQRAFSRFAPGAEYKIFLQENRYWLDNYALFMAIKAENGNKALLEWKEDRIYAAAAARADKYAAKTDFYKFLQYKFFEQWFRLKEYANARGIRIIGDLPIYVSSDSAELWSNPGDFLVDSDYRPTHVAGVPPDYFCEDGQLWGTPLYDWQAMRKNGFEFWRQRLTSAQRVYDLVRIDHFLGFSKYYAVTAADALNGNAKQGEYRQSIGTELFEALRGKIHFDRIIAEDLGVPDVNMRNMLKVLGFPGMNVLQFGFGDQPCEHSPQFAGGNNIVYTCTHDNPTTRSWYKMLSKRERARVNSYCKDMKKPPSQRLIDIALETPARIVIIPMQDYLNIGDNGRMNVPAKAEGNWRWRMSTGYKKYPLKRY